MMLLPHKSGNACFPSGIDDDLKTLRRELEGVAPHWRAIGIDLGIRVGKLDAIETEVSGSMERLTSMLILWLKWDYDHKRHGEPSWRKLVEVVAQPSGGRNPRLAMDIATKFPGILMLAQSFGLL